MLLDPEKYERPADPELDRRFEHSPHLFDCACPRCEREARAAEDFRERLRVAINDAARRQTTTERKSA